MTREIDPERALKVRVMLDLLAKTAREDAGAFFELVMRSERPIRPMRLAEHQKVAVSFLLHPSHRRAVLLMPVRHSKTSLSAAITLWLMGRDPTLRGAIVSATQEQASKVLGVASDYITNSAELRMVFPDLQPSRRLREPWTQTAITVDRPMGIRDPSLKAIGIDGAIAGSRLDWIVVDDILSRENTATEEGRRKVIEFLDNSVLSRLEPGEAARILCIGTPYHPRDALYEMEKRGWATMRMSIDGSIKVKDDAEEILAARERGEPYEHWDHAGVRPRSSNPRDDVLRLTAHAEDSPLWPEVFPPREVERLRRTVVLPEFNRLYMVDARADDEAMCKVEYIETCKEAARKAGIHSFVQQWPPDNGGKILLNTDPNALMIFTGVDLAFKLGQQHDLTAFFTFAVLPDGRRQILDIETGRFAPPDTVDKMIDKHRRFGSVLVVEDVAGQTAMIDFARKKAPSLPMKPYSTQAIAKANPVYGVASLFVEMQAGAWLIPNDKHGRVNKEVEAFIQACLDYVPDKHTADVLMACVAPGAQVTTSRGLKSIEFVREGDMVLTHRGRFQRVSRVMQRDYEGEAMVVKPSGGPAFTMTPEHPVWMARGKLERPSNRLVVDVETWDFSPIAGARVGMMRDGDFLKYPVPMAWHGGLDEEPSEDLADFVDGDYWEASEEWLVYRDRRMPRRLVVDRDFATLIGLYLAEGFVIGEPHQVGFALHEREQHLVQFIREQFARYDTDISVRRGSGKGIIVAACSAVFARFFAQIGARDDKSLLWRWMSWSPMLREQVLRGWLMGDGCYSVTNGRAMMRGTSISRSLIEQMRIAAWQMGLMPSLGVHNEACEKILFGDRVSKLRKQWALRFTQHDTVAMLNGASSLEREHWGEIKSVPVWGGDRTNTRQHRVEGGIAIKLRSLKRVAYSGPVHNFHVEGDESYVVEGVAVHNCFFAREQARKWGCLTGGDLAGAVFDAGGFAAGLTAR